MTAFPEINRPLVGDGLPPALPVVPWSGGIALEATVPGSKSLSNRALLLAALARGTTRLEGLLFSEDSEILMDCLRRLGLELEADREGATCVVRGSGGFPVAEADLYVGNAGTVARFLPAALAVASRGRFRMDGTPAMRRRPILGLMTALERVGCRCIWLGEEGFFPLELVTGGSGDDHWPVDASRSSQILSALLLAAPAAGRAVTVESLSTTVSLPFVEMTLRQLECFHGVVSGDAAGALFHCAGTGYRAPEDGSYRVEPDATAASYWAALPLATGSEVTIRGLVRNGLQGDLGFLEVLQSLGVRVAWTEKGTEIGPLAGRSTSESRTFDFNAISDTFLTLAAIAPLLPHPVEIRGIAHTRSQECDRIEAMAEGLLRCGQRVETAPDSLRIEPCPEGLRRAAASGVSIETYHDHRVAMSFAVLGSHDVRGDGSPWMQICDPRCVEKTFPDFFERLRQLRRAAHNG